jgi:hypothetical protein
MNIYKRELESEREWLRRVTPEEFTKRNVYCGDNCYDNKWEASERMRELVKSGVVPKKKPLHVRWQKKKMEMEKKVKPGVW